MATEESHTSIPTFGIFGWIRFFDFKYLKEKEVGFLHSIELGLDTGGHNWKILYNSLSSQSCTARVKSEYYLRTNASKSFTSN